jgi:D-alanyl-D-alanine carboxypeptidase/D-alanyl-D-alanine-endopeptidase (penicillin-binding protein 4)
LSVNDGWAAFPPSPDVHTPDEDPAADPPQNAAAVVSTALAAAGVNVAGQPLSGKTPASANVVLAQISSPPLKDIVGEMLRESDAQASELLVKELGLAKGGAGATAAGLKAVTGDLAALGLPVAGSVVKDGSGLDEGNLETCTTIQAVLEHAGRDSLIANALPIGGVSGTLDMRFLNSPATGRVHAKTGTLNAVTSLAGFVDSPNGPTLTFSFIINRAAPDRITSADVNLDDKIAELLTTYPQGPSLESVGPKPVP